MDKAYSDKKQFENILNPDKARHLSSSIQGTRCFKLASLKAMEMYCS